MKKNDIISLFEQTAKDTKATFLDFIKGLHELSKNPVVKGLFREIKITPEISKNQVNRYVHSLFKNLSKVKDLKPAKFVPYIAPLIVILVIVLSLSMVAIFFQVGSRLDRNNYIVNIPKGYGAKQVSDLLSEMGIIDGKYGFNLLISMFSIENKIQAGTYKLSPNMPLIGIVWKIKVGDIVPAPLAKVIFPEGTSIYRMSIILAESGVGDNQSFRELEDSPISDDLKGKFSFVSDIKINSLEGYLYPDTYFVPFDVDTDMLRDVMLSRFKLLVMPAFRKSKKDTMLSLHEVLTLASIIEKEAQDPKEREIISSVFHNRLAKRMYLAADPTIKYALSKIRKPTKKVYYSDLEVISPYNTYKHLGLPPGPICNPSLNSIKAAIYPAKTDYLYFVAKKDGTHIFSSNWRDHEEARKIVRRI